jgi:hypothetical protein
MLDLARAVVRFPWTMTVFGAQEVLGSVMPGKAKKEGGGISADLYRVAASARREFNGIAPLFAGYEFVDSAQRAAIDAASDILSLRALSPGYLMDLSSEISRSYTDAYKSVSTPEALRLTVQRIRNIFTVADLVNQVNAPDRFSADGDYPLDEVIADCYAHGEYSALWSVEGVGERYAHAWLHAGKPMRDIFITGKGAKLESKTLLMMHAGAGMAFAKRAIAALTPYSGEAELDEAVRSFLQMCEESSLPGYVGAAIESLGLVTRTWSSQLLIPLSRRVAVLDPESSEYYWHGAGRSMCFSPVNMLPGFSPWFSAEREPRDEVSRRNARAGASWAFTLVNRRHPEIIADFLANKEEEIQSNDAFNNGVMSTLIMAGDMCPEDPFIPALCQYLPSDQKAIEAWQRHIGPDFAANVDSIRKVLQKHKRLGEVFRYQSLSALAADLEQPPESSTQ